MPTSVAMDMIALIDAQPGCHIDPHARDYVGRLFDRFAAQRMKEAGLLRVVKKERVPFVVDPEGE